MLKIDSTERYNMKKKVKGIKVDVRSKNSLYITIGKWTIYIDNSTGEKIINTWEEKRKV